MTRPIIEVENVSKRYRLGQFNARTLREEVERLFQRRRSNGRGNGPTDDQADESEFWALKDVSFSVQPGEVIGIIGRNGAGKSTLLKILSRITEPTSGEIRIRGRVASLLEVGTGFHPELTGRENIYLNGAILGMSRAEVRRKFDEIVAFAEVEKFLDTPVKRYSSGMYVRLAFAVAAHLEPEILIVDEVLAVGDAEFQKKCLGKMHIASAAEGRTVLFVSHNMTAVANLCSRALWMRSGRIGMIGEVKTVTDHYLASTAGKDKAHNQVWTDINSAPGNEQIRVQRIEIVSDGKHVNSAIEMGSPFQIVVDYWNLTGKSEIILNLYLFSADGTPVFESLTTEQHECSSHRRLKGLFRSTCFIPAHLLNEGNFIIQINFLDERLYKLFDFTEAATLSVRDTNRREISTYGRFAGHVHPKLNWRTDVIP